MRIQIKKLDDPLSQSESYEHRYLDCNRYGKCLDKAFEKDWVSFSCIKCPKFKAYKARVGQELKEKGKSELDLASGGIFYDGRIYGF